MQPDANFESDEQTLIDCVAAFAAASPEREAAVFNEERWTYAELANEIDRVRSTLRGMGIGHGDRVAMLTTPRPEFLIIFLATISLGAIWVGINPKYTRKEIGFVISHAAPKAIIVVGSAQQLDWTATLGGAEEAPDCPKRILLDDANTAGVNLAHLESCFADHKNELARCANIDPSDPAVMVYTSGSTGCPKGALISHYGLAVGGAIQAHHFAVRNPRIICNLPVNHVGCVADVCATTLVRGGTLIFQETFQPGEILAAVEKERISIIGGVPTMLYALIEHKQFENTDFSSVELFLWGGAPLAEHAIETLMKLDVRLKAAYGMTETSCHVTFTSENASLEELSSTIGKPIKEIELRIVSLDTNEVVVGGEAGELQFRGTTNFVGYYNDTDATEQAYAKGRWLKTGDLACADKDGSIKLIGRLKEMFKSGGYNIYPREIEMALEEHPEVVQAAVINVPNMRYQEVGAAFLTLTSTAKATSEDLKSYLRTRLANYKIPKSINLMADIPLLPIGKVDKSALKRLAMMQVDNKGDVDVSG